VSKYNYFTWKDEWISILLAELVELYFIVVIGITFAPVDVDVFTRSFDGSLALTPVTD